MVYKPTTNYTNYSKLLSILPNFTKKNCVAILKANSPEGATEYRQGFRCATPLPVFCQPLLSPLRDSDRWFRLLCQLLYHCQKNRKIENVSRGTPRPYMLMEIMPKSNKNVGTRRAALYNSIFQPFTSPAMRWGKSRTAISLSCWWNYRGRWPRCARRADGR